MRIQLLPGSEAEVIASREYALRDAKAQRSDSWFAGIVRLSQGAVETLASKLGLRAIPQQIQTPTTAIGVRGTRFRVAQETRTHARRCWKARCELTIRRG